MHAITVKDIQLCLPRRKRPIARQFYVQFTVDDASHSTSCKKEEKDQVLWDKSFYFDGDDRSVFLVKVYQKHRFGKDQLVGTLTDTVGGALGKLKDGVIEDTLRKNTSDNVTIKFALAAQPRGNINADERQVADAHARAIEAISPTPTVVGLLSSTVDIGPSAVQTFETIWGTLLQRMELFNRIVTGIAEIHPYTSLAWSVISAANQVLVNQKNRDDRIIRLAGTMSDVFAFVHGADPLKQIDAHQKTIRLLIQQVTECGYFVTEYAKQKDFWTRTAKYTISDIDTRITGYENKLQELKTAFLEGVAVQTEITVVRMMNVVKDIAESIDLNDMPYAFGARFQREKGCLPGTRESFLEDICSVLNNANENAPQVCLLTGVAGSGKSAVAHSIARLYDGQKRLGSSYHFSITDVARRNPQTLFSTIARDLSDHDPQYKTALWGVVKDDRALRTSQSPVEQVEKLVIEPSKALHAIGPLVIVIDALDESGDRASRRQLLSIISEKFAERAFPSNLRFLITTRPEDDILDKLKPGSQIVRKRMDDIPEMTIDEDVEKFIYHSLHEYTELESSWPDGKWCRLLVHHSQHLFQWASTACKFIQGDNDVGCDPRDRLDELLQAATTDGGHSLDKLYHTILSQLFTSDNTQERFRTTMAMVLALSEPLSIGSLSALLPGDRNIRAIIKPMGSLLDGVLDEDRPIRPLHTSFRDFLLDDARSSAFHVHTQSHHSLRLGRALLASMRSILRFNICDLQDSRILNAAIPDLPSRVDLAIPPYLGYSCQYWMHHLQHTDCTQDLLDEVTLFFKTFFPYWLEAISLLSLSSPLSPVLSALETCSLLRKWVKDQEIAMLASEASLFIQVFAPVLRESTPHLYLSAMPQTPSGSPLHELWHSHLQKLVSVTSGHPATWPAEVHTLSGHTETVMSVAYSPDGSHIVSGSWDKTIRVWNAITGQCVAGPFQEHRGKVLSVAYSPDGTKIVSGSEDETLKVWDATTGQCIAGPFEGHTDAVISVAYSPDGTKIISGSEDESIRVWDAATGQCMAGPFWGHTGGIKSVAYSPGGAHVVSGSGDGTIRIWDVAAGQCVTGPLGEPTKEFVSVVYSPDGTHIASAFDDGTIRVLDAITGQLAAGLFQGHKHAILSLAYSPNGSHIVSGSADQTIRIWDAITGESVAGPFQGHADTICSVVYSPDGTQIASGSADDTIRVWNATIGQPMANLSQSHTEKSDKVLCVAYSPDGTHIVSGLKNMTIWIWDAITGHCVVGPLQGHRDRVHCVAYSPDGTHIVSGSEDNAIQIWDAATGQSTADLFHGHTNGVRSVVYSPDGTHIASGSGDETVRVWDAITGQCVAGPFQGHTDAVHSVAYSPDGTCIVSGSEDDTIRVWEATTGQSLAGPFLGHTDGIKSVSYSPDGSYITSGSRDKTIRIWNAITGQCVVGPLQGHTHSISSVAYSPDGSCVVSGSADKTIRLWDASTGQSVSGPLQGHTERVMSVAYSPDGTHIVSGSWDRSIKVWKACDLASLEPFLVEDGWFQSSNACCFGWIAPWNRSAFQSDIHSLVISSNPIYPVNSSTSGESWTSCWI